MGRRIEKRVYIFLTVEVELVELVERRWDTFFADGELFCALLFYTVTARRASSFPLLRYPSPSTARSL